MTIIRLTRTFPRTALPGAGLHAYYYSKGIKEKTIVFTKSAAAPFVDIPANAEIVEVEYSDFSFRKKRERHRYALIAVGKLYGDLRFLTTSFFHLRARLFKVDIIHLHSHTYVLTALALRFISGARIVVGFHGTDLLRLEGNRVMAWLIGKADGFLYVSSAMEPKLRALFPKKELCYTGNLVDLEVFTESHMERDKTILAVGNLRWQKDYPTLVRAFARFCEQDDSYRLLIAGDGPDRLLIEQEIEDQGLTSKVQLLGMLDRNLVKSHLGKARALVLSSISEGFPKVIIEAMACGTPVVSTDVGNCREVIGDAGITVPAADEAAFCEALLRISSDVEFYKELRRKCRPRAENYGVERVVEKVAKVYDELLGGQNKGRRG